jgi:hypothetical protein
VRLRCYGSHPSASATSIGGTARQRAYAEIASRQQAARTHAPCMRQNGTRRCLSYIFANISRLDTLYQSRLKKIPINCLNNCLRILCVAKKKWHASIHGTWHLGYKWVAAMHEYFSLIFSFYRGLMQNTNQEERENCFGSVPNSEAELPCGRGGLFCIHLTLVFKFLL